MIVPRFLFGWTIRAIAIAVAAGGRKAA